jgi:hypothetical protein
VCIDRPYLQILLWRTPPPSLQLLLLQRLNKSDVNGIPAGGNFTRNGVVKLYSCSYCRYADCSIWRNVGIVTSTRNFLLQLIIIADILRVFAECCMWTPILQTNFCRSRYKFADKNVWRVICTFYSNWVDRMAYRHILPAASLVFLFGLLSDCEDGSDMFFRNSGLYPTYTVLQPTRPYSSYPSPTYCDVSSESQNYKASWNSPC